MNRHMESILAAPFADDPPPSLQVPGARGTRAAGVRGGGVPAGLRLAEAVAAVGRRAAVPSADGSPGIPPKVYMGSERWLAIPIENLSGQE